jgi:hypothetical protein
MKTCIIKMVWDDGVWCAESDNEDFSVVLESDSFDTLLERVKIAIQDILEIDIKYTGDIRYIVHAEREDTIKALAS